MFKVQTRLRSVDGSVVRNWIDNGFTSSPRNHSTTVNNLNDVRYVRNLDGFTITGWQASSGPVYYS